MTPKEWHTLESVRDAGCPVDFGNLLRPACPVRAFSLDGFPAAGSNDVYRGRDGIIVLLNVQVEAFAPVTLSGFRMEADWLTKNLIWVAECPAHVGYHCVHEHKAKFGSDRVLTNKTFANGRLCAGYHVKGLLLGRSSQPTVPLGKLAVTLFVELVSGQEFPFRMKIWNLREDLCDPLPAA